MAYEIAHGGYLISDDPARIDVDVVHWYISEQSYWSPERPRAVVARSIAHSLCLGAYAADGTQVGFARVVTDYAVMAHLNDVFVLPADRGKGLGEAIVGAALGHPALAWVGSWTLRTRDAHGLYARFGFIVEPASGNTMRRLVPVTDFSIPPVDGPVRAA